MGQTESELFDYDMKSLISCVRGTRYPWYKENIVETIQNDIDLSEVMSKISN